MSFALFVTFAFCVICYICFFHLRWHYLIYCMLCIYFNQIFSDLNCNDGENLNGDPIELVKAAPSAGLGQTLCR